MTLSQKSLQLPDINPACSTDNSTDSQLPCLLSMKAVDLHFYAMDCERRYCSGARLAIKGSGRVLPRHGKTLLSAYTEKFYFCRCDTETCTLSSRSGPCLDWTQAQTHPNGSDQSEHLNRYNKDCDWNV